MSKAKATQSRSRTADEMRAALQSLASGDTEPSIAPNYDAPADILRDAIDELLANRQTIEEVRAFVQAQSIKLSRR